MLAKANRLSGKANFEVVFKRGEKQFSPYFVGYRLVLTPQQQALLHPPKIGIVTSKKVGGAVERNHARRLISTGCRALLAEMRSDCLYIFICTKKITSASTDSVTAELRNFLSRH